MKGIMGLLVWKSLKKHKFTASHSKYLSLAGSKRSWIILFKYCFYNFEKLLNFPQATGMSNKFMITLQDHFRYFSTSLILAPTMPTKMQGVVQRLQYVFKQRTTCWNFLEKLPHNLPSNAIWKIFDWWRSLIPAVVLPINSDPRKSAGTQFVSESQNRMTSIWPFWTKLFEDSSKDKEI